MLTALTLNSEETREILPLIANNQCLRDNRAYLFECLFNGNGRHVFSPCRDNQLLQAARDVKVAGLRVEVTDVARVEETLRVHHIESGCRVVQVTEEEVAASDANLTDTLLVWVKDLDLGAWQWLSCLVKTHVH
jgi:hypothetical protein